MIKQIGLLKGLDLLRMLIQIKFLNKRYPLAIRWQLTNRCPSECKYCKIWKAPFSEELSTKKILGLLDEMSSCGTKKISFSGGEPLLRDDIGQIINHCKKAGISPEMNSTGYLLKDKIREIKGLDLLKISLDGPLEVSELVRGKKESYQWAVDAASCARANNLFFIFTTTLTKFNINYVEDMVCLAKEFNTLVAFQPLKEIDCQGIVTGELESIWPPEKLFKQSIDKLIGYKKKDRLSMRNSLREFKHIYNWPHYKELKCWGGKIFCMIAPNGEVAPCDRLKYNEELPNCAEIGFQEAFNRLPPLPRCEGCGFCGTVELNYLMSFKFDVLNSIRKILI